MSGAKSLDMQRAEHALQAVETLKGEDVGHYVSYVRALPANILQNGLGQSMATLLSASRNEQGSPHQLLYRQIQCWLCRKHVDAPYAADKPDLIRSITGGGDQAYLHAHAEALAYLVWLKKFAVAFLREPESGDAR